MKVSAVIIILDTLLSMAVAIIVFGQWGTIHKLSELLQQKQTTVKMRVEVIEESQYLKDLLLHQLDQLKKDVQQLNTDVPKHKEELNNKNAALEDCKTKNAKIDGDLAGKQKEQTDTEATINKEKEYWAGEITTLKKQTEQESPVCRLAKKDSEAKKLCHFKEGEPAGSTAKP